MAVAVAGTLLLVGVASGTTTAIIPETFHTRYRSTGTGVAFNMGSVVGGAIPPIVAAPLVAAFGSLGLAVMMAVLAGASGVCVAFLAETKGISLQESETEPVAVRAHEDVG
ncbi:hypothetical protein EEB14_49695 [Rhodococcus sp. WS4]|nr:hypothetical protein EEB14_49695 [Rhodococcus sp. WS4]